MHTLYFIRGLPGSGKSTFANRLLNAGIVAAVLEADSFFIKDGVYNFNPQLIAQAHYVCHNRTMEYLKGKFSVAVSNTSTTESELNRYKDLADEFGAEFISVVIENRHGSSSIHNVPEETIDKMKKRFSIKL